MTGQQATFVSGMAGAGRNEGCPRISSSRNQLLLIRFRSQQVFQITFCVCRRPGSRPSGRRRAVHRLSSRPISPPAVASGRRPRRGKSVLCAAESAGSNAMTSPLATNAGRVRSCIADLERKLPEPPLANLRLQSQLSGEQLALAGIER